MYKDYRDGLMLESLRHSQPAKKLKYGGAIKQRQVVRSDQSRNYGGSVNISKQLMAQAEEIRLNELVPLEVMIFTKQQQNIAQGKGSRIPAKYHKALNHVKSKINRLKNEAKEMIGEGYAETHNEPKIKFVGKIKG